ncbi:SAM-dependent methyltransferase [Cyclobacterium qasimii]|uniref:Tetrapyrrole (Corrin-Porphyrin) methylase family protein n=2 Tax=Cyclobacterium qasimii TaxID=1350429 RepID=S7WQW3_9BACT|nr:SAM-dependent methyltransferase [Cyclobacterium qasimii]EPR66513.1 Tetrapyrrole (Corrin-Porphyrin) methylase family protein [Cyclobacterium qasimii M12-11B]GEO21052.1 S-adenosylmethionine-dependent methyltransferase [Cyclobacterium qasimii]
MKAKGILYLIPNVLVLETGQDIMAPVVKNVIAATSHYLVEDFRTARRYISSLKLGVNLEEVHLEKLDKKTPELQLKKLLAPLLKGHDVGILSEAGCPGIADPGANAVALAHKLGIKVVPLPGPSSMFMALMGSGFNGQSFTFNGYLPIDRKDRVQAIKELEAKSIRENTTQMFMETPFRNNRMIEDLLANLSSNTLLCIASNITGTDEMILTKKVADWRKKHPDLHKIPAVFLIHHS